MPSLVPVPKLGQPLQGRGRKQYGRNGKSAASLAEAVLGRGGGIHGHVITKKNYELDFDGLVPFDDPPKADGVVSKRQMSDAELSHRKKINATSALTTSTLGLSALGSKVGGVGLRKLGKFPKVAAKLERAAVPISLTSGGIGGVSGYNYAAVQRAEAKRQHPVGKAYHPETSRQNRNQRQVTGMHAVSAGIEGGALGAAGAFSAAPHIRQAAKKLTDRMDPITGKIHVDPKLKSIAGLRKLKGWTPKRAAAVSGAALSGAALHTAASGWKKYNQAESTRPYAPRYRGPV